ncbi:MAG TPA: monovalent cation/H(+) antiporter subunit G [Dongiaceae bacterium]|jgi:multicomponent K+:H+ antiporter subunit G
MTDTTDLPAWVAALVSLFVVAGAALTLIGSVGLLRLPSFYQRIHAPTLGTTLGTGAILIASMLFFTTVESRPVLGEILIAVFVTITTPISFILLVKATRRRARSSTESSGLPPRIQHKVAAPTRSPR